LTLSLVELIRPHALSHPFLLFLLCLAFCRPAHAVLSTLAARPAARRTAAVLVVGWFCATLILYLSVPAYFDHVEPSVAAVSWAVMQGQTAYPGQATADMYGLPYGPALFLLNGAALRLLGPGIIASKVAGALAVLASVIITGLAVRRAGGRDAAALMALACLAFGVTAIWVRAEPLLLFCSSLAVLSVTLGAVPAAIIGGLALGIGVNLKASAVIYLLPALAVLWRQHGLATAAAAVGLALLAAAVPFVFFENISLAGYAYWIQSATVHGIRWTSIPATLEWALFLVVPIVLGTRAAPHERHTTLARIVLVVSILISVPLAAKHGTGFYHFLPFVPAIVFSAAGIRGPLPSWMFAWLVSLLVLAAVQVPQSWSAATGLPAREIVAELRAIDAKHEGVVAMGYSPNYRLSFFRPVLVFDGNPYLLDGASLMDWHWSRRPFPAAVIDALRNCVVAVWVIPKGSPPFELPNAYPIEGQVLPDRFRQAFRERYTIVESGQWFDVWRCK
jgi:hypothetical protein